MTTKQTKTGKWPWLLVAIAAAFLVLSGWATYRAALGTSQVTDPDYYSHGLKYNQASIEARAAETMAWRVSSTLENHSLTISLQGGDQQAVSGCRGELVVFNHEKRIALELRENAQGSYTTDLPDNLVGSLTGDLILQRNGARISRRLLINL